MAKDSRIEWTHHTFNPWWGCVKVSPACANCYAETWAHRLGAKIWGRHAPRRFFGDEHWKHPLRWNAEAERDQVRRRVFCASMADVFEVRAELNPWRARLWPLIEQTPWLDWLLLTKRPKNVRRMAPWGSRWPHNVWLGTTDPDWVRSLRDECHQSGIAFHFKQWGHWAPELPHGITPRQKLQLEGPGRSQVLYGLGKSAAGRLLDGRTWDQFPT
jgi:protein gp37